MRGAGRRRHSDPSSQALARRPARCRGGRRDLPRRRGLWPDAGSSWRAPRLPGNSTATPGHQAHRPSLSRIRCQVAAVQLQVALRSDEARGWRPPRARARRAAGAGEAAPFPDLGIRMRSRALHLAKPTLTPRRKQQWVRDHGYPPSLTAPASASGQNTLLIALETRRDVCRIGAIDGSDLAAHPRVSIFFAGGSPSPGRRTHFHGPCSSPARATLITPRRSRGWRWPAAGLDASSAPRGGRFACRAR